MKSKRILSAALAGMLAVGALSGCGQKKETGSFSMDGPKAYDEQIELKIPVYDRATSPQAVDNNYWTQYVQKEFGDKYNIKVTYVPISRKEDVQVFNNLFAAGDEPDLIFSYDYSTALAFQTDGAFMEIPDDVLNLYAPTFAQRSKELESYSKIDGKRYFLLASRPKQYNWVNMIRTDWLEKAGLEMPQSQAEYIDVLRKFKELKLGGANTIPQAQSLCDANFGNYAYRPFPMPEEENALYSDITVCSLTYEASKKQLQYMNKLYNEGLISPEWSLDKNGEQAQADFVAGKVGVYGCYLAQNGILTSFVENNPDGKVEIMGPYAGVVPEEEGGAGVPAGRQDNPYGMISGISKNSEHPEAVLMFLEWMCQPENLYVLQNGYEGETYNVENVTVKKDGEDYVVKDVPVMVSDYKGEHMMNYSSNKDMWCLVTEGKEFDDEYTDLAAQMKTYAPAGFEYLVQQNFDYYKEVKQYCYPDYTFSTGLSALSQYKESLLAKWQSMQVKLVQCSPENFEAEYESASKEYLDYGYQKILDEKKEIYDSTVTN